MLCQYVLDHYTITLILWVMYNKYPMTKIVSHEPSDKPNLKASKQIEMASDIQFSGVGYLSLNFPPKKPFCNNRLDYESQILIGYQKTVAHESQILIGYWKTISHLAQ